MQKINDIARYIKIPEEQYELYGKYKAKINASYYDKIKGNNDGKLILVTATNPTPMGEGKTTQSIGLSMALNKSCKNAVVSLREPSLGPVFGIKGGAIGGGKAIVEPSQDINLHFNGDFHAITSANNLLCAVLDNHIYQGNILKIDSDRICIKRVIDINDRSLRNITVGDIKNKYETGFELTVASELMAICALSLNKEQLKEKIDNMIVAYDIENNPVFVKNLNCTNAMMALLDNVLNPNLVQTSENTPALIHLGPFANIAHGCSSLISTKIALKIFDYVVTEAGFGADLGAEKFFDIKCRIGNLKPNLTVLVTTIKSLKYNGGCTEGELTNENIEYLKKGIVNLNAHIENLEKFNVPVVVVLNKFGTDTENEINFVKEYVENLGLKFSVSTAYTDGSNGCIDLANKVIQETENIDSKLEYIYNLEDSIEEKINKISKSIYGAKSVNFSREVIEKIKMIGDVKLPVCIAKTPASFSDNPKLLGRPKDFEINVRDIKLNNGAGFVVAYTGNILTMPGLGKKSNYERF